MSKNCSNNSSSTTTSVNADVTPYTSEDTMLSAFSCVAAFSKRIFPSGVSSSCRSDCGKRNFNLQERKYHHTASAKCGEVRNAGCLIANAK